MRRLLSMTVGGIVGLAATGCSPDLGECDPAAAERVFYTDDDLAQPAYGGQALMISSCGGGSFCHSDGVEGAGRYGAPEGLDYDVMLADTPEQAERLRDAIARIRDDAGSIWSEVHAGRMPPGEVGADVVALSPAYVDLPPVDRPEGEEILRNWLACGAPVVERTTPRPEGIEPVGDIVPAASCDGTLCGGACVDLLSDGAHCGACDSPCSATAVCIGGACMEGGCPSGTTECDGGCVDIQTSSQHCGGCGNLCEAGRSCVDGTCSTTGCSGGLTECGGSCVDTASDGAHCGGCGVTCAATEVCSAGTCTGCDDSVSFSADILPLLTTCGGSMCHGGTRPSADLRLDSASAHSELVGVASTCPDGRLLVDPGNPDGSYLIAKLTGIGMCAGNQMPLREPALSTAEIALFRNWICTGAAND